MCDPIIVNPVMKMRPHPAAHSHQPLIRKCSPPPGSLPGRDHSRFFFHSSPNIRFLLSLVSSVRVRSLLSWLYCPTEVFVDNSVAPSPQKSRFSNFDSNSIVFTTTKGICYQLLSIFSLLCFIFSLNWIKQLLKETENGTPHYICIGNSMICRDIWHKYHE